LVTAFHISTALLIRSRERQKQLDELSKELARVTEETEMLKRANRGKAKEDETCLHCKPEIHAVTETVGDE